MLRCLLFLFPFLLPAFPLQFEPGTVPRTFVSRGVTFTGDGPRFAPGIRMTFPGGRTHFPEPGPVTGYASYFAGRNPAQWREGVPQFDSIRYQAIYPGIDLVFHHGAGKLEYDFHVEPGVSPSAIRIRFPGAKRVALHGGELYVDQLRNRRPLAYQLAADGRREVSARYHLTRGEVSFELGDYDPALPLVIDPVVVYATYAGGSGSDTGNAIAVDASGNAFLAGTTDSSDFAVSKGATAQRAYLAKLDSTGGNFTSLAVIAGASIDGMALDAERNPVVTGSITTAAQFPGATSGAYHAGATGFVARFTQDASGLKLASISTFAATPAALALDATGAIYVTGSAGATFQTTTGALQAANAGGTCFDPINGSGPCPDAFVLKLSSDLKSAVYATYLGGKAEDAGRAIAVDSAGEAYITGDTASADFPVTPGAAQPIFGGRVDAGNGAYYGDAFVAKLDAAGARLIFATYLGGTQPDIGYGIAVDGGGNAYVTGSTQSSDFPVTANAVQKKYAGGTSPLAGADPAGDAFVARYSASGARQWSTYLGGSARDIAEAIAVDAAGNVYVTGTTESPDFPFTSGAISGCRTGGPWIAELDTNGTKLMASTSITGMGFDEPHALALDAKAAVYVAGDVTSEVFFSSATAAQKSYAGGNFDAFAVKLDLAAATRTYVGCVLNAASYQAGNFTFFPVGTVAPGEIVSLFGGNLGPAAGIAALPSSAGTYSTTLGGTQVMFDGLPAPLLYVGSNQINAVAPFGIGGAATKLTVQNSGATAGPLTAGPLLLPVAATVPAIFTYDGSGIRGAAIVNQDGTLNTPSSPAPAGSIIAFYATGGGTMSPRMADGSLAPLSINQAVPAGAVSVQILGNDAPVLYAGSAPGYVAGLLQINVRIPDATESKCSAPLMVTIGGQASQFNVTVAVVNGVPACQ
jgi:uncharacterized protein (TIGR03437 family)